MSENSENGEMEEEKKEVPKAEEEKMAEPKDKEETNKEIEKEVEEENHNMEVVVRDDSHNNNMQMIKGENGEDTRGFRDPMEEMYHNLLLKQQPIQIRNGWRLFKSPTCDFLFHLNMDNVVDLMFSTGVFISGFFLVLSFKGIWLPRNS
jgi:hypothetical protein